MVTWTPLCPALLSGVCAQTEAVRANFPDKLCEAGRAYFAEKGIAATEVFGFAEDLGVFSLAVFDQTIDTNFVLISTPAEPITTYVMQVAYQGANIKVCQLT